MKSDRDREFEQNMSQLLQLLKKILSNPVSQGKLSELPSFLSNQGLNLNLFFLTFLPMSADELDELEEIYEHFMFDEELKSEDLTTDLNSGDIDFLKRHGIKF